MELTFNKTNYSGETATVKYQAKKIGYTPFAEDTKNHPVIMNKQVDDEFHESRRYFAEYSELGTYLILTFYDIENCNDEKEAEYALVYDKSLLVVATMYKDMFGEWESFAYGLDGTVLATRRNKNLFVSTGKLLWEINKGLK